MATTHLIDITDQEALERVYIILNENREACFYRSQVEDQEFLRMFDRGKFEGYHHAMSMLASLLERNPDKVLGD